jgi:hypothetical protein
MPLVDPYEYGFIEVDEAGAIMGIQRKPMLSGSPGSLGELFR